MLEEVNLCCMLIRKGMYYTADTGLQLCYE